MISNSPFLASFCVSFSLPASMPDTIFPQQLWCFSLPPFPSVLYSNPFSLPFLCLPFLPGHHVSLQSFPACKNSGETSQVKKPLPIILPSHSCWLAAAPLHLCPSPHPTLLLQSCENYPDWEGSIIFKNKKNKRKKNSWAERISGKDRGKIGGKSAEEEEETYWCMKKTKTVEETEKSNCQDNETEKITRIS